MRNLRRAFSTLVLIGGTLAITASGQAPERPRGTGGQEPPMMSRAAYQPPVWLSDDDYVRWPLPPGEQQYAKLDGKRIKAYIREITAISRKSRDDGNQYWGRIVGTQYDKMTTDWVAAQFTRLGLEQVRIQEFDTLPPQWFPTSWEVTAAGTAKTVAIKTAYPLYQSVGTDGTIELEPIWLGTGTDADFMGRDVKGKLAIVSGFPNPGGRNDTALQNGSVKRAEAAGAAGLLVQLAMPGNIMNEPQAATVTPPASMPVFMVGNDDGNAIREMIEKRQAPKVKVRLAVEMKKGLKTANVWGVLPGASDEQIAVMAHTDAFFEGAMDNASGIGTMLELAQYYASIPKAQRRRTMTFFTTSAHHSPSGEEAGIRWVHNHMQEMFAKTALILNCEHTSQVQTYIVGNSLIGSNMVSGRRWFVGGSAQLKKLIWDSFKLYGEGIYSTPEPSPGGELSQVYRDAPSFHIIDHTVYHTDLDTPDQVPESGLEQSVRMFAHIIDQVNKLDLSQLKAPAVPSR